MFFLRTVTTPEKISMIGSTLEVVIYLLEIRVADVPLFLLVQVLLPAAIYLFS